MELLTVGGVSATVIIIGISEIFKRAGFNSKFIPVINLVLGLVAGIVLNQADLTKGVFLGLAVGLSASGLYSGAKNVVQEVRK